jgi:hypothetical protein
MRRRYRVTNRHLTVVSTLLLIAATAIVFFIWSLAAPAPAPAGEWWEHHGRAASTQYRRGRAQYRSRGRRTRGYRQQSERRWERELRFADEQPDIDSSPRCLEDHGMPIYVDVTSTEHTNTENSMEAANKMWAAKVQWHHGSKWMDLKNANDRQEGCSQSNAMDTMSGRISETANKLIGQEGQNQRCVIVAQPCRMILKPVGNGMLNSYR